MESCTDGVTHLWGHGHRVMGSQMHTDMSSFYDSGNVNTGLHAYPSSHLTNPLSLSEAGSYTDQTVETSPVLGVTVGIYYHIWLTHGCRARSTC